MSLEQHTVSDRSDHELAKVAIYNRLRHTESKADAVSSKDLAELTPVSSSTVRDLVAEVRREYDIPIVSCSKGYYRVTDVDDLERHLERINDEIATRENTKRELTRAWNR